jgi:hypothetical protein
VAIAIGAITHALIYVILIRASQGGGLLNSVKATFHRDKKNTTTNVNQSKFDNWYRTNLVQDNWYYRAKVLKQPAII